MNGVVFDGGKYTVPLTPKADTEGVRIRFKVFWKTTRFWTEADVADFQNTAPSIAERLRTERYWNKKGEIQRSTFTCEDFAIRVLCEYAASRGLPVKLTTGVRTYRNMEMYDAERHDRYSSNMYGFSEMVMLTYAAADMQTPSNTISITGAENILSGDILAQAKDKANNRAHHIQVVTNVEPNTAIHVVQGSTYGVDGFFASILKRIGINTADPRNQLPGVGYLGIIPVSAMYKKVANGWNYKNHETGREVKDFLSMFLFYRWNFKEFNQ